MTAPPSIRTSKGPIGLGKLIGKGGEASVYEITGSVDKVAKIYHSPKTEQGIKVAAMLPIATADLLSLTAWPLDLLYGKTGSFAGLVLPRVTGHKDIHNLYSPRSRKTEFPNADWKFLIRVASNTARAFAAVHHARCVIGDVNHGGVLVSDKATVRIIDCDSFQFETNGKRFFCDVGVPTFTPPELQGKPFRGVVRTTNHDNFGLAILIFHLLFMGRHPFAGRFLGRGDMSLERAITEFRFAYGAKHSEFQMEPPPNVPGLMIASPPVAALFERAMAQASAQANGRPAAREWVAALDGLEKNLKACANNSSHEYFNGLDRCPWCHVEAATGATLFNAWIRRTGQTALGNIEAVWAAITRVQSPGPLPRVSDPAPQTPSPEATAHGQARKTKALVGHGGMIAAIIGLIAIAPQAAVLIIIAGIVAWIMVGSWASSGHNLQRFQTAERAASERWKSLKAIWESEASDKEFAGQLRQLQNERDQLRTLPSVRQQRYQQLERDREKHQRQRFLERFEIEKAKISGIGPGRKAVLASYNIETAWDVAENRIMNVPGFGPALTGELLAWRRNVEAKFRFDPSKGVDPQDIAALDRDIVNMKSKLEQSLAGGVQRLTEIRNRTLARRSALQPQLEQAATAHAQAAADLRVA